MGKRASQKEQVRKRLMKEALLLFSKRGLEKTTVADIVQKSEIARGTFYNYFTDTQSLFDCLIDELNKKIKSAIQQTDVKAKMFTTIYMEHLKAILTL